MCASSLIIWRRGDPSGAYRAWGGGRRPPGSNDRGAEAEAGMSGGGGFPEGDGLWASP